MTSEGISQRQQRPAIVLDNNVSSKRFVKPAGERGLTVHLWSTLSIDVSNGEVSDRDWLMQARRRGFVAVTLDQFRQRAEQAAMLEQLADGLLLIQLSGKQSSILDDLDLIEAGYKRCLKIRTTYSTGALVRVRHSTKKGGHREPTVEVKYPEDCKRRRRTPKKHRINWCE